MGQKVCTYCEAEDAVELPQFHIDDNGSIIGIESTNKREPFNQKLQKPFTPKLQKRIDAVFTGFTSNQTPGAAQFGLSMNKADSIAPVGELSEMIESEGFHFTGSRSRPRQPGSSGTGISALRGVHELFHEEERHREYSTSSPMGRSSEALKRKSTTGKSDPTIPIIHHEEGMPMLIFKKASSPRRKPTPYPAAIPSVLPDLESDLSASQRRRAFSFDTTKRWKRKHFKSDPSQNQKLESPRLVDFFSAKSPKKLEMSRLQTSNIESTHLDPTEPDFGPPKPDLSSEPGTPNYRPPSELQIVAQHSTTVDATDIPRHSRLRVSQIMQIQDIPPEVFEERKSSSHSNNRPHGRHSSGSNISHSRSSTPEYNTDSPNWAERALVEAATIGNQEKLIQLLRIGAPANAKDSVGYFAIWWAARNCHLECIKLLLNRGANIDACNHNYAESFPLAYPCFHGDEEIVEYMLSYGASVETHDSKGWQPAHFAASGGHLNILKLLAHFGADLAAVDFQGQSVYDLARSDFIRRYLREELSFLNESDKYNSHTSSTIYLPPDFMHPTQYDSHTPPTMFLPPDFIQPTNYYSHTSSTMYLPPDFTHPTELPSTTLHTPPDFVFKLQGEEFSHSSTIHPPHFMITTTRYEHSITKSMRDPPTFDPYQPDPSVTAFMDPPTFDPNQPAEYFYEDPPAQGDHLPDASDLPDESDEPNETSAPNQHTALTTTISPSNVIPTKSNKGINVVSELSINIERRPTKTVDLFEPKPPPFTFNSLFLVFLPPMFNTILILTRTDLDFPFFADIFSTSFIIFIVYFFIYFNALQKCQGRDTRMISGALLVFFLAATWVSLVFMMVQMLIDANMNEFLEILVFICSFWCLISFCYFGKLLSQWALLANEKE